MTNNCFIAKLTGIVDNNNLPVFGMLVLQLQSPNRGGCYFRFNKATKITLINATFVSDSSTELTVPANTDYYPQWIRTNTSEDSYLLIHDKYALVRLDGGSNSSLKELNLEDLKWCDNLISLIGWTGSKPVGDFAVFNKHLLKTTGIFSYYNTKDKYDVERMLEARYASTDKVGFTINYANSGSGPIGNGKGLYFGGYEIKFGDSTLVATISGGQVNVTATVWDNGVEKTITGTYDGSSWSYA